MVRPVTEPPDSFFQILLPIFFFWTGLNFEALPVLTRTGDVAWMGEQDTRGSRHRARIGMNFMRKQLKAMR